MMSAMTDYCYECEEMTPHIDEKCQTCAKHVKHPVKLADGQIYVRLYETGNGEPHPVVHQEFILRHVPAGFEDDRKRVWHFLVTVDGRDDVGTYCKTTVQMSQLITEAGWTLRKHPHTLAGRFAKPHSGKAPKDAWNTATLDERMEWLGMAGCAVHLREQYAGKPFNKLPLRLADLLFKVYIRNGMNPLYVREAEAITP